MIAADNLFDLPGGAATIVDQNDLAIFQGAHRGSVLTVLAAKAQRIMIRIVSAVTQIRFMELPFTFCRSTRTSRGRCGRIRVEKSSSAGQINM